MRQYLRLTLAASLVASMLSVAAQDYLATSSRDGDRHSGWDKNCAQGIDLNLKPSLQVVGLTKDQRLICFNEYSPDKARDLGYVAGLNGDTVLIGIDFRVQDGRLYGVGNQGGVYTLDNTNAVATKVSQLTVGLEGSSFGVDFNPPADRLRIVSDTGQNLRHNINPGGVTLVDDPLDYPPGPTLNSVGPNAIGVTGSAYTNNDLNPDTATTLYALDSELNQTSIQSPPNDGTLAMTGRLTVDPSADVGFDIYSTIRNGLTVDVQALASLRSTDGNAGLHSVNLPTGRATLRGHFNSQHQVIGIAIPLNQLNGISLPLRKPY